MASPFDNDGIEVLYRSGKLLALERRDLHGEGKIKTPVFINKTTTSSWQLERLGCNFYLTFTGSFMEKRFAAKILFFINL
ncbi:MAG: hypothetical protein RDV48_07970 [Candidatus Eremiobacteraeota bacterium]|nr:hypothetical protein [Candidatus Eremiobacteraeota bacterium]